MKKGPSQLGNAGDSEAILLLRVVLVNMEAAVRRGGGRTQERGVIEGFPENPLPWQPRDGNHQWLD